MGRKYNLSQAKFIERFRMDDDTREERVAVYIDDLKRGDRSRVLMTQIPLRLVTHRIDANRTWEDNTRDYCDMILGYRAYRMYRMECSSVCLFAWSPMTERFHATAASRAPRPWPRGPFVTRSGQRHIEEAISREVGLESPHSLCDSLVRTALVLDEVPLKFRTLVSWVQEEPLNRKPMAALEAATGDFYPTLGGRRIMGSADLPNPLRLLRVLRSWPQTVDKMFGVVDSYGLPDGLLGLTLEHADNFRTF
tara:strand:+ start:80 stop:832 length:753 start_codon:yes stop_codon:yes gene_type:complete